MTPLKVLVFAVALPTCTHSPTPAPSKLDAGVTIPECTGGERPHSRDMCPTGAGDGRQCATCAAAPCLDKKDRVYCVPTCTACVGLVLP